MLAPGRGAAALVDLEHRDVGHEAVGRRAVPVVFAGLEEDAVAGADDLDRPTAALAQADPLGHPDRLAVRVGVPGRAGARREVDAARVQPRAARRRRDRVDVDGAGEPLLWAPPRLERASRDLHPASCSTCACPCSMRGSQREAVPRSQRFLSASTRTCTCAAVVTAAIWTAANGEGARLTLVVVRCTAAAACSCRSPGARPTRARAPGDLSSGTHIPITPGMRVPMITSGLCAAGLVLAGWAVAASAATAPTCSPTQMKRGGVAASQARSAETGAPLAIRYCGRGRVVFQLDGRRFVINGGRCTSRRVGMGVRGDVAGARSMWLLFDDANRVGRNGINDGEFVLPGYAALGTVTGTAIRAKGLNTATFSVRWGAKKITGTWTCGNVQP